MVYALIPLLVGIGYSCDQKRLAGRLHETTGPLGSDSKGRGKAMIQIEILPAASAATRLLVSPDNKYVAAELHGTWVEEAFPGQEEAVPPVLKLIDLSTGNVVGSVNGWALGAPSDEGDLFFLEEFDEEYQYRLRSFKTPDLTLNLAPPAGFWLPKAALRITAPNRAVVVLWSAISGVEWRFPEERRERLWIASIDTEKFSLVSSLTIDTATPMLGRTRFSVGVAANPLRPQIYILELPEPQETPDWHVRAYSADSLQLQWRSSFSPAMVEGEKAGDSMQQPQDRRHSSPPPIPQATTKQTAGSERLTKNALIGVSGDGAYLAVVYGPEQRVGVGLEKLIIFNAADGSLLHMLTGSELKLTGQVSTIASIPGAASVALLHLLRFREDLGENYQTVFHGGSLVDLSKQTQSSVYEVSRVALGGEYDKLNKLLPGAMTVQKDGTLLIAPQSYYWVRTYGGNGNWPAELARGADQPEVRGLVKTPLNWHTVGRRRVNERRRFLKIE